MPNNEGLLNLQLDLIDHLHKLDRKEVHNPDILEAIVLPFQDHYLLFLDNLEKVRRNANINNVAVSINDVDITNTRGLTYEIINEIENYPEIFYPLMSETGYAETKITRKQRGIVSGVFAWQEFNSTLQQKRLKIPSITILLWALMKTPRLIRKANARIYDSVRTIPTHEKYRNLADRVSYEETDIQFMDREIFRSDFDLDQTLQGIAAKTDSYLLTPINVPAGEFPESHYKAALTYLILDLTKSRFTPEEKEYYLNLLVEFRHLHNKFFPILNAIEKQHYKRPTT